MPLAENAWVCPIATAALAGVTVMELSVTAVVVANVVPLIDPIVAVMVAEPADAPIATPYALTET